MTMAALAIGGSGALSSCETTVLLSVEDTPKSLAIAESIRYSAPGH